MKDQIPDFLPKIKPEIREIFDKDFNSLGFVNEYEFNALRIKIVKEKIEGIYIQGDNYKVEINSDGTLENYSQGIFDYKFKQIQELLKLQMRKRIEEEKQEIDKIVLTGQELEELSKYRDDNVIPFIKGLEMFQGWTIYCNINNGDYDNENRAMIDFPIELRDSKSSNTYTCIGGCYTYIKGISFSKDKYIFVLEK